MAANYATNPIVIRTEPDLRAALTEAARRERTTMAELARRTLRAAVLQRGFDLAGYVQPPEGRR